MIKKSERKKLQRMAQPQADSEYLPTTDRQRQVIDSDKYKRELKPKEDGSFGLCETKLRHRISFRQFGRQRYLVVYPRVETWVPSLHEVHEVWEVQKESRSRSGLNLLGPNEISRRFERARGVPRRLPCAHAFSGAELYDIRVLISDAFE